MFIRERNQKEGERESEDLKEGFDFVLFYWHHDSTKSIYQYPSISTFRLSTYFSTHSLCMFFSSYKSLNEMNKN